MVIDSHTDEKFKAKKHTFRSNILLVFVKTFKKVTKISGFELKLKTSNEKQKNNHTTLGGYAVNVTINIL